MGMYINENGQLDYRSAKSEGAESTPTPLISPELLEKAGELAKDVGGTTLKAAAIGAGAVGTTAAVSAGCTTAATAIAGGAAATYVAMEVMNGEDEEIESTGLEDARGGVPYEQVMKEAPPAAANDSEQAPLDPFEAFRQCMQNAGMETTHEINSNTACLPDKPMRHKDAPVASR